MSKSILILGASGSGKSASIRTLNPEETIIISAIKKELPFPGSARMYTYYHKKDNPNGNLFYLTKTSDVIALLDVIPKIRKNVKNIVIDDNSYLTIKELDRRRFETGYGKFSDIAHDVIELCDFSKTLPPDVYVFFLHHTTEVGDGLLEPKKIKSISFGKMVEERLGGIETQFTVTLLASKIEKDNEIQYVFLTKDANSTTKTPMGMFEDTFIPNDLQLVRDVIDKYYNG